MKAIWTVQTLRPSSPITQIPPLVCSTIVLHYNEFYLVNSSLLSKSESYTSEEAQGAKTQGSSGQTPTTLSGAYAGIL